MSNQVKKMLEIQRHANRYTTEVQDYVQSLAQWTEEMKMEEDSNKEQQLKKNSVPTKGAKVDGIPIWDMDDWEQGKCPRP